MTTLVQKGIPLGDIGTNTTGVTHTMQTTGIDYDNHQHSGSISTGSSGIDLMNVINEQGDRIEELEALVKLLLAEVLPERAI